MQIHKSHCLHGCVYPAHVCQLKACKLMPNKNYLWLQEYVNKYKNNHNFSDSEKEVSQNINKKSFNDYVDNTQKDVSYSKEEYDLEKFYEMKQNQIE